MSLAATLRPTNLSFSSTLAGVYGHGTDNSAAIAPLTQDSNYLALNRTLIRFQNLILLTPSPLLATTGADAGNLLNELTPLQRQIQAELYSPLPYHRTKWLHNIQGARNLLLQLERQAQGIKVQRTKREVLKDLGEKRSAIKRLRNRVEEIGREVEGLGPQAWNANHTRADQDLLGDKIEDVLGKSKLHAKPKDTDTSKAQDDDLKEGRPITDIIEAEDKSDTIAGSGSDNNREALFGSSLRRRGHTTDANMDSPSNAASTGHTSGFSNLGSTEKSLAASSRTHENLTASLVSMAAQLKQQTRAFEFTLNQDKNLLDRALEGLDRNVSAMDIASKNMAFLRRMSEGEGWLGRMKLYAIIFGMWVFAILLVFVMPKLRF